MIIYLAFDRHRLSPVLVRPLTSSFRLKQKHVLYHWTVELLTAPTYMKWPALRNYHFTTGSFHSDVRVTPVDVKGQPFYNEIRTINTA